MRRLYDRFVGIAFAIATMGCLGWGVKYLIDHANQKTVTLIRSEWTCGAARQGPRGGECTLLVRKDFP